MSKTKSTKKMNKKVVLLTAISALLTAVLVLSGVGIYLKVAHKEKNPIVEVNPLDFSIDTWDGSVEAINFNENYAGRGTKTKTINSAASFAHFIQEVNNGNTYEGYTIYLNSSIDLKGQTIESIGASEHPFKGTFDGGHYTIYNAKVNGKGLFGVTEDATIKNIGLYNANTNLIDKAVNTNIENCFVRLGNGNLANEYISNNGNHHIKNSFVDSDAQGLVTSLNTNDSSENAVTISNSYYTAGDSAVLNKVGSVTLNEVNVIKATKTSDFEEFNYSLEYDATKDWCNYDYLEGSKKLDFNLPVQSGFVKTYLTGSCYESVMVTDNKIVDVQNLAEAFKEADKEDSAEINLLVEKIFMEAQATVESAEVKVNAVKDTTIVRGENNTSSMFVGNGTSKIVLGSENQASPMSLGRTTQATLTLDGNREYVEANDLDSSALIVANGSEVEIHDNVVIKNNVNNTVGYGGAVILNGVKSSPNIKATFENCNAENGGGAIVLVNTQENLKITSLGNFENCSAYKGGAIYITDELPAEAVQEMARLYGESANIRPMDITEQTQPSGDISGNDTYNGCSAEQGGAIYYDGGAGLTISGSPTFTGCSAIATGRYEDVDACGGAIYTVDGGLTITGSPKFQSNYAQGLYNSSGSGSPGALGGAIGTGSGTSVTLSESCNAVFDSNYCTFDGYDTSASMSGGGIYCTGTLTISGSPRFTGNYLSGNYGGPYANGAAICGSSIYISGDPQFISNGKANSAYCQYGGAISAMNGSEVNISGNVLFEGNTAACTQGSSGGAIYCYETELHLTGSIVFKNNTAYEGCAIYQHGQYMNVAPTGSNKIQFINNNAYNSSGTAVIEGSTIQVSSGVEFINNFNNSGSSSNSYSLIRPDYWDGYLYLYGDFDVISGNQTYDICLGYKPIQIYTNEKLNNTYKVYKENPTAYNGPNSLTDSQMLATFNEQHAAYTSGYTLTKPFYVVNAAPSLGVYWTSSCASYTAPQGGTLYSVEAGQTNVIALPGEKVNIPLYVIGSSAYITAHTISSSTLNSSDLSCDFNSSSEPYAEGTHTISVSSQVEGSYELLLVFHYGENQTLSKEICFNLTFAYPDNELWLSTNEINGYVGNPLAELLVHIPDNYPKGSITISTSDYAVVERTVEFVKPDASINATSPLFNLSKFLVAKAVGTATITLTLWEDVPYDVAVASKTITVNIDTVPSWLSSTYVQVPIGKDIDVGLDLGMSYIYLESSNESVVKITAEAETLLNSYSNTSFKYHFWTSTAPSGTWNLGDYMSAVGLGTAQITVHTYDGNSDSNNPTYSGADYVTIQVYEPFAEINVEDVYTTLSATIPGTIKSLVDNIQVKISSSDYDVIVSDGPEYVEIELDANQTINLCDYLSNDYETMYDDGAATITIEAYNPATGFTIIKSFTVTALKAAGTLSQNEVTVFIGDSINVTITSNDSSYQYDTLEFISSDSDVVNVTDRYAGHEDDYYSGTESVNLSNHLSPVGEGTAIITIKRYTYDGNSSFDIMEGASQLKVTVIDKNNTLWLEQKSSYFVVEEDVDIVAHVPTSVYPNAVVKVSSSASGVVEVTNSGYLTPTDALVNLKDYLNAKSAGNATITVNLYENSSSSTIIETSTFNIKVRGIDITVPINGEIDFETISNGYGSLQWEYINSSNPGTVEVTNSSTPGTSWDTANLKDYVSPLAEGVSVITYGGTDYASYNSETNEYASWECVVVVKVIDPAKTMMLSELSYETYKNVPIFVTANIPTSYSNAVIKVVSDDNEIVQALTSEGIHSTDFKVDLSRVLLAKAVGTAKIAVKMYSNPLDCASDLEPVQTVYLTVTVREVPSWLSTGYIEVGIGDDINVVIGTEGSSYGNYNYLYNLESDNEDVVSDPNWNPMGGYLESGYSISLKSYLTAKAEGVARITINNDGSIAVLIVKVYDPAKRMDISPKSVETIVGEDIDVSVKVPDGYVNGYIKLSSTNSEILEVTSGALSVATLGQTFNLGESLTSKAAGTAKVSVELYSDSACITLIDSQVITIKVSAMTISATEYYLFNGQKVCVTVQVAEAYKNGYIRIRYDGDSLTTPYYKVSDLGTIFSLADFQENISTTGITIVELYADNQGNELIDSKTLMIYSAGSQFALSSYDITAMKDTAVDVTMTSSEDFYYYEIVSSNPNVVKVSEPTGSQWWASDWGIDYHFSINEGSSECPKSLSGYLTAVGVGTATITIKSIHMSSDSGSSGSFVVKVINTPLISLDKTEVSTETDGVVDVNVTAVYQNATYITITSSNPKVVLVANPTGTDTGNGKSHLTLNKDETVSIKSYLTVLGAGNATITVTGYSATEGFSHSMSFTVTSNRKKLDTPTNFRWTANEDGLLSVLTWDPVEHVTSYHINLYRDGTALPIDDYYLTSSSYDCTRFITEEGIYHGSIVPCSYHSTSPDDPNYATGDEVKSDNLYVRKVNIVKGENVASVTNSSSAAITSLVLIPGQTFALNATASQDYVISGWTSSDEVLQITNANTANPTVKLLETNSSCEDITLTVTAKYAGFNVSVIVNNPQYGSVDNSGFMGDANASITTDGNKLKVGNTEVVATPAPASAEYTYVFTGWTGVISELTRDVVIMANFERTRNNYNVKFTVQENSVGYGLISNGSTSLQTQTVNVPYGTSITFENNVVKLGTHTITAVPTEITPQYSYSFVNWNGAVEAVNGNTEIFVEFSRDIRSYTVTIVSNDENMGTVTQPEAVALYGTAITADGSKLTIGEEEIYAQGKGQIGGYIYSFDRWIGVVSPLTKDITITAVFIQTPVKYTITITKQNGEYGNVSIAEFTADYGSSISDIANVLTVGSQYVYATTIDDTAQYDYKFVEWIYTGDMVVGDMEIVAKFEHVVKTYEVTIAVSENGTISSGSQNGATLSLVVDYDTKIVIKDNTIIIGEGDSAVTFTANANEGYTFEKWSGIVGSVRGTITITAIFA